MRTFPSPLLRFGAREERVREGFHTLPHAEWAKIRRERAKMLTTLSLRGNIITLQHCTIIWKSTTSIRFYPQSIIPMT